MIVGGIEEVRLDEAARELYTADNYLGGRVMVFDLDTFSSSADGARTATSCRRSRRAMPIAHTPPAERCRRNSAATSR